MDTLINLMERMVQVHKPISVRTQHTQEHTYIVVKTNITVKLTVMIASKKKGLK